MTAADTGLFIDGDWTGGSSGRTIDVTDPATGAVNGKVAVATEQDLERAA